MIHRHLFAGAVLLFFWACLPALAAGSARVEETRWEPVDPTDLAATESASNPGADAEFLRVKVSHRADRDGSEYVETRRIKIYTARGVALFGSLNWTETDWAHAQAFSVRVVKPDGTIVESGRADTFTTTVAEFGWTRKRRVVLVVPGVAPGDVVDVRVEVSGRVVFPFLGCFVQSGFAVREFEFRNRSVFLTYLISWVNCPEAERERKEDYVLRLRNVPPFEEEPLAPPMRDVRGSIYLFDSRGEPDHVRAWAGFSYAHAVDFDRRTKPGRGLNARATQILVGAKTGEEKLRRLYEFCQNEIANITFVDRPRDLAELERRGKSEPQWAGETLRRGSGSWKEINELFAALARASGFQVRLVLNAPGDAISFATISRAMYFLHREHVAVEVGGVWQHFDPGNFLAPYGLLEWRDEGVVAVRAERDGRQVALVEIPTSGADVSRAERTARLALDSEGTVEGAVEETFTGQRALARKLVYWNVSDEEVAKRFRAEIRERLPDAEIFDIAWTNLRTSASPLVVRYQVRIAGYAARVGERLTLRPNLFEVGRSGPFTASARRHPIHFPYAWRESDRIEISLPEGFELDQASTPLPVGDPTVDIGARYTMRYLPKARKLALEREFVLWPGGVRPIAAEKYPILKDRFDALERSDNHAVLLKPRAAGAGSAVSPDTRASTGTPAVAASLPVSLP